MARCLIFERGDPRIVQKFLFNLIPFLHSFICESIGDSGCLDGVTDCSLIALEQSTAIFNIQSKIKGIIKMNFPR